MTTTRYINDVIADIEALPTGDIEGDHVLLDRYTVETLKQCLAQLEDVQDVVDNDDLLFLLHSLIKKWDDLREDFFYA